MSEPNVCTSDVCNVNYHGKVEQPAENEKCTQCGVAFGEQGYKPPGWKPKKSKQGDK